MMIIDGHVHTPFCPHGTRDTLKQYVENAIFLDYHSISFTEHAPLPKNFHDPVPTKDSAISLKDMESYIKAIQDIKETYKKDINVHIGLEVDYIEGYEGEIREFLNTYGPMLTDSILSVHFLKASEDYVCMDYGVEAFKELVQCLGSVDAVYKRYFETVLKSISADLGTYKPERIGHMTLVQKFKKQYPATTSFQQEIDHILDKVNEQNYSLDVNSAGLRKPYCLDSYPPDSVIAKAKNKGINLVYGSDAHKAEDLGKGYEHLEHYVK
ncbi:histidinol-phosphatase HisJ [Pontibacillus marinus]|nr:histidinol-phosphatase HisJ [Pontibacillus marinus]